jgi:UTP-glucose-1-phosphate uridylyltransferase
MKPTLVILAAGMGSRYGGLKQVDALGPNGETIIDYSVFDAMRAGFGKVVFVIRKNIEKDFLEVFGNRFKGKVPFEIVFQELDMLPEGFSCPDDRTKPWGTAHALWVTRKVVKEPFAAINADDFYGFDAFRVLEEALSKPNLKKGSYFMVGYRLGKTLSEQGFVSRGVCTTDKNSMLQTVIERTQIERVNGKVCYKNEKGENIEVDETLPVSMNCWGLTPDFFDYTEDMLSGFLSGSISNAKAEFYIPTVVNKLVEDKKATCEVLPTSAEWFGVTYPGDKPMVMGRINELVARKDYPSPLWK